MSARLTEAAPRLLRRSRHDLAAERMHSKESAVAHSRRRKDAALIPATLRRPVPSASAGTYQSLYPTRTWPPAPIPRLPLPPSLSQSLGRDEHDDDHVLTLSSNQHWPREAIEGKEGGTETDGGAAVRTMWLLIGAGSSNRRFPFIRRRGEGGCVFPEDVAAEAALYQPRSRHHHDLPLRHPE